MSQQLQMRLDGTVEAAHHQPVRGLLGLIDKDCATSSDRVRVAWMNHEVVQAFIINACGINIQEKMHDTYWQHLQDTPAFESFCRAARNGLEDNNGSPTPTMVARSQPPKWYQQYLATPYWKRLAQKAKNYYGSCVLCGETTRPECHHRHYRLLGEETMMDVSILCHQHHQAVHPLLGIRVPRDAPPKARKIIDKYDPPA